MKKNKLILIVSLATIAILTLAAMYTPPTSSHAITGSSKKGGFSRHPVLLGLNEKAYEILVTGRVLPPLKGDLEVKLEGEPRLDYTLYSRYPQKPELGIGNFHGDVIGNIITDAKPGTKYVLSVYIKPEPRITKETRYKLTFYEKATQTPVMTLPVIFTELKNFSWQRSTRRPYARFHESEGNSTRRYNPGQED